EVDGAAADRRRRREGDRRLIRRWALVAAVAIAAGAFEPFYFRIFLADRAALAAREVTLPYRKLPGSQQLMHEVRARTKPGDVIGIAAPFPKWDQGYWYLYTRALYPLTGRVVLPLLDEHDRPLGGNVARANVIAAYRCEPHLPGFTEVWRGPDGVLLRRTP
ncbi:MAG TPA: hypothetical protein VNN08_10050, partial [Thermoanaerobaculia bacterium]|nr:hypothetical protein [Thermoanaerobaculia bacterium]